MEIGRCAERHDLDAAIGQHRLQSWIGRCFVSGRESLRTLEFAIGDSRDAHRVHRGEGLQAKLAERPCANHANTDRIYISHNQPCLAYSMTSASFAVARPIRRSPPA